MTDSRGPLAEQREGALANEVEGYLLARADQEQARREADAFCARLPWLTTAQAEEVARLYAEQHIELTRQRLRHTIRRAEELRREYEARYAQLRHRLLTWHALCGSAVLACATGVSAAVCAVVR
ncbi:hypothetical protein C3489_00530 [Streptomyces sp. Ru71]|uniref:hypothetical protein n=1 Tax=Streptomyces sp. Ru71 TaxID=2080746 RepID=UPI000CDD3686|nr:hypothetical protein [Streptomyces sp. Ru71]POX57242.1 hypothetical protein C3489_00530 [Streptomyces sp. Ru71]